MDEEILPSDPRYPSELGEMACAEFTARWLNERILTLTVWDPDGVAAVGLAEARKLRDWLERAIETMSSAHD
ncbi:hypothetical protein [Sphingobium nicotianae]|uniref:hypothetical protein n=1 Tax=Sphingobium nicotianae TaxID=2782607 RepID=UPI001BE4A3BA|nr:hypothetical protein [Sphingobium nicotianae]